MDLLQHKDIYYLNIYTCIIEYLFHLVKHLWGGYWGRRLLNDLLVPPLYGAVPTKQGNGVPVVIGQNLHLQVPGMCGQLHYKDGGSWNLSLYLQKKI